MKQSPPMFRCTASFLGLLMATASLQGADRTTNGGDLNLWGLIQQGGWAMYPLGLCSIVMLFLILHAVRETKAGRFIPDDLIDRLLPLVRKREFSRVSELLAARQTVLTRSLEAGLQRARSVLPDANKARVEETVSEGLEHEENAIGQWINYLNVVATVAPMIGLLGTVSGMIGAFQTISAGGMGRPELLAGDIGEALITTAVGLVIGIPAMVAYFILRARLDNRMMATAREAGRILDQLDAPGPENESDT
ncbi:MAG: MotA/TolQ/ExbB proton channel family protein [Opitutaceae bacterium]